MKALRDKGASFSRGEITAQHMNECIFPCTRVVIKHVNEPGFTRVVIVIRQKVTQSSLSVRLHLLSCRLFRWRTCSLGF